jgi:SAM-dependent methyltransferase
VQDDEYEKRGITVTLPTQSTATLGSNSHDLKELERIAKLVESEKGIHLDIGCGAAKMEGYIGMDVRAMEGVDIVHDVNIHPWPLPDECVSLAICSHLVEHIPPVAIRPDGHTWFPFVAFMDEVWRLMKVGGTFMISLPYAHSEGFAQDPTHVNMCNHTTFKYFDPTHSLWGIYQAKPWFIQYTSYNTIGNLEIALKKHSDLSEEKLNDEYEKWFPLKRNE